MCVHADGQKKENGKQNKLFKPLRIHLKRPKWCRSVSKKVNYGNINKWAEVLEEELHGMRKQSSSVYAQSNPMILGAQDDPMDAFNQSKSDRVPAD